MAAGLVALAAVLRHVVFGDFTDSGGDLTRALEQWLSPYALAAALFAAGAGAVYGAGAAPRSGAAEEIQSSLLAGLPPSAICGGHLVAVLRIPLAVLLYSGLMWSLAQAGARVVPAEEGGFGAILLAHVILVCVLFMTGAVAFAVQTGARGRSWGGGVAVGLLLNTALIASPLLVNSRVQVMDDPSGVLQLLLLVNPVFAVESAMGRNILRAPWVYAHTSAADYLLDFPSPLTTAGLFFCVGLAAYAVSAWKLRAAFRR
jgi:hypothetical protein